MTNFDLTTWAESRQERRTLRQKLFQIRIRLEAKKKLTKELKKLRKQYEELDNFTEWSGFPERWDIGDPKKVRMTRTMANPDDKSMVSRMETLYSSGLDEIVHFGKKQWLDKLEGVEKKISVKEAVKQAIH